MTRQATIAAAVLTMAALAGQASAALFSIGSATGTSQMFDPAFKTFTSTTGMTLPQNFALNNVGDMHTFDGLRYFTDEISANQVDDPTLYATTMSFAFTGPAAGNAMLNGNTHGDVDFTFIPGVGTVPTDEYGIVEWTGPVQVTLGIYTLELEATDTKYNTQLSLNGPGEINGANVPVTVTLVEIVPEPASMALIGSIALPLLARRRRA